MAGGIVYEKPGNPLVALAGGIAAGYMQEKLRKMQLIQQAVQGDQEQEARDAIEARSAERKVDTAQKLSEISEASAMRRMERQAELQAAAADTRYYRRNENQKLSTLLSRALASADDFTDEELGNVLYKIASESPLYGLPEDRSAMGQIMQADARPKDKLSMMRTMLAGLAPGPYANMALAAGGVPSDGQLPLPQQATPDPGVTSPAAKAERMAAAERGTPIARTGYDKDKLRTAMQSAAQQMGFSDYMQIPPSRRAEFRALVDRILNGGA